LHKEESKTGLESHQKWDIALAKVEKERAVVGHDVPRFHTVVLSLHRLAWGVIGKEGHHLGNDAYDVD
jgi:hypothetical protein